MDGRHVDDDVWRQLHEVALPRVRNYARWCWFSVVVLGALTVGIIWNMVVLPIASLQSSYETVQVGEPTGPDPGYYELMWTGDDGTVVTGSAHFGDDPPETTEGYVRLWPQPGIDRSVRGWWYPALGVVFGAAFGTMPVLSLRTIARLRRLRNRAVVDLDPDTRQERQMQVSVETGGNHRGAEYAIVYLHDDDGLATLKSRVINVRFATKLPEEATVYGPATEDTFGAVRFAEGDLRVLEEPWLQTVRARWR